MPVKYINSALRTILGEKLFGELETALKDQDVAIDLHTKTWLPGDRQNELFTQRDDHKARADKLAGDFDTLVKSLGATNAEEFKTKYAGLTETHKKELQDAETKYLTRERDYLVSDALRSAKARNPKPVLGMLDFTKITVKEGKIDGLDPQLAALKTSDPYLFETEVKPQIDKFGKPIDQSNGTNQTIDEKAAAIAREHGIVIPTQK